MQMTLAEGCCVVSEPEVPSRGSVWLGAEAEHALVANFMAGTPKGKLAEQYEISVSSVQRHTAPTWSKPL
jgi:hypothetical protein